MHDDHVHLWQMSTKKSEILSKTKLFFCAMVQENLGISLNLNMKPINYSAFESKKLPLSNQLQNHKIDKFDQN